MTTQKTIAERVAAAVTPELVDTYQREGAVRIRGLFTPEEIEALKVGIDENLARPSDRSKVASRPEDPGWFFEDFCNWQDNEAYKNFIAGSAAPSAAAALMRADTVRLYHDHLLVKEPGTVQRTPWHQDQPYYNIDGEDNVSMWIPADSVPIESALEFIAGSHRGPWLMPRTFMDKQAKWFPEGTLADLPDIEADRDSFPIRRWALEPGDMVCFHMLTLHASAGATSRRRAFSLRFMGDDVRHAPRAWKTSPDFPGLADQLPSGAPMDHPLFPVVWTRQTGQIASI
jgi:ectoine hydroxylase-related dioxygenase (phytanoyl-CoA dioxygenase family)